MKADLLGILNSGYKNGECYTRAKQDSEDVEFWTTYGPKALAGTREFNNALNSRCITVPMERATRKVNMMMDRNTGAKLRMKLLDYRNKNLDQLPEFIELPFENGRNHELFMPLLQVMPKQYRELVIKCGLEQEKSRKVEDVTSFEGDVLRALLKVVKKTRESSVKVSGIFEEYRVISSESSDNLDKNQTKIKNRMGRTLKSIFHLTKAADKSYSVDIAKITRMMGRFTPDLSVEEFLGAINTLDKLGISGKSVMPVRNDITDFTNFTDSTEGGS